MIERIVIVNSKQDAEINRAVNDVFLSHHGHMPLRHFKTEVYGILKTGDNGIDAGCIQELPKKFKSRSDKEIESAFTRKMLKNQREYLILLI